MAKFPAFDMTAVKIRELLNHRKTKKAKALAREALASGKVMPDTAKLAAVLLAKDGPGRHASGPYKWIEIGEADYWMDADGVPRRKRILRLLEDFPDVSEKHIEKCVTMYRKVRDINEEESRA